MEKYIKQLKVVTWRFMSCQTNTFNSIINYILDCKVKTIYSILLLNISY